MQDEIDMLIEKELTEVVKEFNNKVYVDYGNYEDDVAKMVYKYCPVCTKEIKQTTIGITILWGQIRNYIRSKANIQFVNN
jgi:hypothetical protein